MRLRELRIRNFRKIENMTVAFPRGLAVIVGENNVGKTAIIDALRLVVFSSRDFDAVRLNEDDFRSGTDYAPIEISCIFSDPTEEDEVYFQECLVDIGGGRFDIQLNVRIEYNESTRRVNSRAWGGETEGGMLPHNLYDRIAAVYLQPLRDPENALRPGQHSLVSRLIDTLAEEADRSLFVDIMNDANERMRHLAAVETARNDINAQMVAIAGSRLAQKTDLIFGDPTFHRIIAGLHPEIEGLPFALNGLGYNNLIFTSAILSTLRRSPQFSFRCILVEEPEAHLHPQLQVLLLRYLAQVADEEGGNPVQVIASSHSPILASQAPAGSIVALHQAGNAVSAVSICTIDMDKELQRKLERFLDATRAELFFARRILMVEGIAEALLLPVLAKAAGGSLRESAVTVLNVEGLNFNAFLPLFGEGRLAFPVAILTDGDAPSVGAAPSATAAGLKAMEADISNVRVFLSERTLEHELARSCAILPFMLAAFHELHPVAGQALRETINGLASADQKADAFLAALTTTERSKGRFAQELASQLESTVLQAEAVPTYIRDALQFLGVTGTGGDNVEAGNTP